MISSVQTHKKSSEIALDVILLVPIHKTNSQKIEPSFFAIQCFYSNSLVNEKLTNIDIILLQYNVLILSV